MKRKIMAYIRYLACLFVITFLYLFNNHTAMLMILFIAIILPLMSVVCFFLFYKRFQVSISFSHAIVGRGEKAKLIFHIKNSSLYPQPKLSLYFEISNEKNPNNAQFIHELYVGPKEELEYEVEIGLMNCGNFKAKLIRFEMWDLFDFVRREIQVNSTAECISLPIELAIESNINEFSGDNTNETVYEKYAKGNDPSEIFEIREFHNGDRLQTIHWNLSAKQNELMVKVFSDVTGETFDIFLCNDYTDNRQMDSYFDLIYTIGLYLCRNQISFSLSWVNSAGKLIKRHIDAEEQVSNEIISLYFEEPVPNAEKNLGILSDIRQTSSNVMMISAQSGHRQNEMRLLMSNNQARLFLL